MDFIAVTITCALCPKDASAGVVVCLAWVYGACEAKRTRTRTDDRVASTPVFDSRSSTCHSKRGLARESEQCPRSPEQSSSKRRKSSQRPVSRRTGPKGEVGKDGWTTGRCRPAAPGTTSQCSCRPCPCPVPPSPHRCTHSP